MCFISQELNIMLTGDFKVWGTLIVAIGQTLLMVSLAEFCSIWPTAGGQQYYTQALATGKFRPFLSYLVGWAVLVGEISTGSSCALNSSQVIASFVEITHPEFVWKPWLTWVVYCVFLIGPIVQNLAPKYLPALNVFGAFWTIGGGLAWAISFLVMAPKKSSGFVFKTFINNTGYTSKGWVFIMSFYTPMYGLYGTDGMMHLVEEMKDASRQAPVSYSCSMGTFLLTESSASNGLVHGILQCYILGQCYPYAFLRWKL